MPVNKKGFTLIELLVVLGILAIIMTVAIVTLNPSELFKQSRDSRRSSELATINKSLTLYEADKGVVTGSSSVVYVSLPDPAATTTAGTDCASLSLPPLATGWTYHCASPTNFQKTDGTGWIPVNLDGMTNRSPISQLPKDPTNTSSGLRYYSYSTNGRWVLTARMDSKKYALQSGRADNGFNPIKLEVGPNVGLSKSIEGLQYFWPFEKNNGTQVNDEISANHGTLVGPAGYNNLPSYAGSEKPLGHNVIGSSVDSSDSNYINAHYFQTPGTPIFVKSLSVYVANPISAAPNNKFQMAIYTDSGSSPSSLVAKTAIGILIGNSWNTLPLTTTLSPNTTYWIAYNTNGSSDSDNNFRFNSGGANQMKWRAVTFGDMPSSFGSIDGMASNVGSMYLSYTIDTGDREYGDINSLSFDGADDYVYSTTQVTNPQAFSLSLWMRTATSSGAKIIGFESNQIGTGSGSWDRHIYVGTDGKLRFGWWTGAAIAITSINQVTDNNWHHIFATYNSGVGSLYIDGVLQGNTSAASAVNYSGYWRLGSYRMLSWPNAVDNSYYSGQIDNVRIYNKAFSDDEITAFYAGLR